jgi:predicted amidohydrolase YtcJ
VMSKELGRRSFLGGAGAVGLLTATGVASAQTGQRATGSGTQVSTIIVNGQVFTGTNDPSASAVAVAADGTIAAVGSNREIRRLAGYSAEVIDAGGGTVMAGIHDGHMHPLPAAEQSLSPSLNNAELTVPELQALVQSMLDATSDKEPDGWLHVTNWNPVGMLPPGTVVNKSILDALDTARPIYLQGSDFHNSLVNSRALELAGVDNATPDPSGGEIVRDGTGEATGLLKDNAQWMVAAVIPPPTDEELAGAYQDMGVFLLASGITSFMDAVSSRASLRTYRDLLGRDIIKQTVIPALAVDAGLATRPDDAAEMLRALRSRFGDVPRLRLTTAKVFMDGVMEFPAQTAALLQPYLDADGQPTDNKGDLYVSNSDFGRLAVTLDREGWQVHTHAIGDRAVRVALNGYEAALRANGRSGNRHTITHLELVHPDDYARFGRLGVIASMQLQWAVRNVFTLDALRPYIGEGRFNRLYPARSLSAAGARLAGGSDWPVDPLSPFNQIATAVDRTTTYSSDPTPLDPDESISRGHSLRMHTRASAFQMHSPNTGTIAQGKNADLIILDRDITSGPVNEIREAAVKHTMIAGEVVYDATSTSQRGAVRKMAALAGIGPTGHDTVFGRHAACCGGS